MKFPRLQNIKHLRQMMDMVDFDWAFLDEKNKTKQTSAYNSVIYLFFNYNIVIIIFKEVSFFFDYFTIAL